MGIRSSTPRHDNFNLKPNAVQRAIANPAIMAHILSQLSPEWTKVRDPDNPARESEDEDERENRVVLRATLAACAQVCRAFSGPAMDAQWRVLDDVVVLLKILPHTITHPDDEPGLENGPDVNPARLDVLALSPNIKDAAWVKFRGFARRVRELNAGPPKCYIHPDVWNALAAQLQGTPLLPRLQRLHMSVKYRDPASFILCLSPTLRYLSFAVFNDEGQPMSTDAEFVQNIVSIISAPAELPAPLFRRLARLLLPESTTESVVQHLRSLGRLSRLEVLNLVPAACQVEIPALRALSQATFSSLCSLRLAVPRRPDSEGTSERLHLAGLATIRHLHLSGRSEDIFFVLSAILPADLRDLSLCIRGSGSRTIAGSFRGFRRFLPDALESFECTLCEPISKGPQTFKRLFHAFLKYRLLKRFVVHVVVGYGIHVFDRDIHAFASSWPNLEQFVLRYDEMLVEPGMKLFGPSVASLGELVRGCPRLRLVRLLGLDVGAPLPPSNAMPEGAHASMRHFDPCMLLNDDKVDLDEVARALDGVFPDLEDVPRKVVDCDSPRVVASWDKVQELMQARRAARRLGGVNSAPRGTPLPVNPFAMISLLLQAKRPLK